MTDPTNPSPVTTALPTVSARELDQETLLVLVVNSGSSSLKYQVREITPDGEDTADPVSLEHIALATRIVSEEIDELPLFNDHPYDLQVTSPGASRPLSAFEDAAAVSEFFTAGRFLVTDG